MKNWKKFTFGSSDNGISEASRFDEAIWPKPTPHFVAFNVGARLSLEGEMRKLCFL